MTLQFAMFQEKSDWVPPTELPDLSSAKEIAIDLETKDPNIIREKKINILLRIIF